MAITAFTSTAIIDATTIGRTVLTALSEGIAADAIGLGTTDSPTFADGNFTGTVQSEYVTGVNGTATDANLWFRPILGHLFIKSGASNVARFASTGVLYYANVSPQTSGLYDIGTSIQRWRSVGSVDGTFSGNLNTEVGGTQRVYNLGTDGDTDTEYLETSWDTNVAAIETKATGSGAARELRLVNGLTSIKLENAIVTLKANNQNILRGSGSSATYLYSHGNGTILEVGDGEFKPFTGTVALGSTAKRWSNTHSVDGDFSGDVVMAANVDFTGLPTSDPLVAGRLWNDSGTMKISAG